MGDVKSNTGVQENPELDTSNDSMDGTVAKMIAPTLRVEELRDEALNSSYTSEEEGVLSHGEGSDGGGDGHSNLPQFQPPNDELKEKIVKQVEFYFSDINILKDAFLLKHVRRNKYGFVSLKLITSFRKVKSLTKDFRVVAFSLRESQELVVNEEGTKVKRIAVLPDYDETTPSRTVVAVNFPDPNPSIASVDEIFSKCGIIALIRILKSGKSIPPDIKKHLNKHPELNTSTCAVVEYETHEAAQLACKTLSNEEDWRKGMHVTLLAPQRKEKKADKRNDKADKDGGASGDASDKGNQPGEAGAANGEKKRRDRKKKKTNRFDDLQDKKAGTGNPSSGSEAEREHQKKDTLKEDTTLKAGVGMQRSSLSPKQDMSRLSPSNTPRSSPRNTPKSSPRSSPRGSPNIGRKKFHGKSPLAVDGESPRPSPSGSPVLSRRKSSGGTTSLDTSASPSGSPWVQRRLKAQQDSASPLAGTSPVASPSLGRRMGGLMRHPRGPDGTIGFYGGKGRGALLLKSEG